MPRPTPVPRRQKHGIATTVASIYVTLEPLPVLPSKLVMSAGIREIYYETPFMGKGQCPGGEILFIQEPT